MTSEVDALPITGTFHLKVILCERYIIERHLKLLSSRHRFTCDITQDRPIRSDYAHIIGTERLGTNISIKIVQLR